MRYLIESYDRRAKSWHIECRIEGMPGAAAEAMRLARRGKDFRITPEAPACDCAADLLASWHTADCASIARPLPLGVTA